MTSAKIEKISICEGELLMTLKQLQYIVTVAEEGNITSAAKKLFIAQPSLTAAIRELENEYNVTIFTRSNKGRNS